MNTFHQEFINGYTRLTAHHKGCVATIGSFDGVHLGHQAILASLREVGQRLGLPTLAIIFEPQPHEYFAPASAPARIMRLREKVLALFSLGIDRVLCLRFNEQLRSLSAEAFIQEILVNRLAVAHLEIGDDFRFGCDRAGDFSLLQKAGAHYGFSVRDTQTLLKAGDRVSSTRIRKLLELDDLNQAAELLGRPFTIMGRVIHGRKLGRTLNVPTANIGLGRSRSPIQGVYAVKAQVLPLLREPALPHKMQRLTNSENALLGVANVGVKPTVDGGKKALLEVHLLDFSGDLYGQCLRVEFCSKLRNEQKFSSLDELQRQIGEDIQSARHFFNCNNTQ